MALEEQLLLSIDDALNSVGQLETALTSAASLFASSLTDALSVLDSLQVGTIDATEVTTAIDAAVTGADLSPVVTADASSVTGDIDAAVQAVDAQVTPSTDAGSITSDIDAAVQAVDATVPINVDTSAVAGEIDAAIAGADATVTVSADTSQAQSDISNLGSAASGSTGEVDTLSSSVDLFSSVAQAGTGNFSSLAGEVSNIGPGSAVAVGAVTALAATTVTLFNAASDAQVAEQRFAASLGDMAGEVRKVNIGGLNEDLFALATRTGNSKTSIEGASASIATLGRSAGATEPQIAETVKQIDVLAIRATTLNPALGDAGDVAEKMTAAFAKGGRALVPFGIALTKDQIELRAMADTGKTSAADLTVFDRAAAGAALRTEQLGTSLGTSINDGAKKASVQIKALKEEFVQALEVLGRPLLDPLVRALREGQPLLIQIGTDLGHLAEAVLPLFAKGIEAIAPLVGGASVAFGLLLDVIGPVVDLITKIPTPILTAVAAFAAVGPVLQLLPTIFFAVSGGIDALIAGFGALASPLGLVALAVGTLVGIFTSQADSARKAKADIQAYADGLLDTKKSIDQFQGEDVAKRFKGQSDAILAVGTSLDTLKRQATEGKAGYDAFLSGLVETGRISEKTKESLLSTGLSLKALATESGGVLTGGERLSVSTIKLADSFRDASNAAQKGAEAAVKDFAAQSQANRAAVEGATSQNKLTSGKTDFLGVLRQVKPALDNEAAGQKGAGDAASKHAEALKKADDALNALVQTELAAFDSGLKLERAQIGAQTAAIALTAAQKDAATAVKEHGAASDEARDASIKLHTAELDVEQSALQLAQAHVDAENKTRALTGASLSAGEQQHITAEAFRQTAQTVGVDSPLGQKLIQTANQLDSIHSPPPVRITADTSQFDAAVRNVQGTYFAPLVQRIIGQIQEGRMAGGPVAAGDTYVVGEREAEVFVPTVSGTVFNQAQLRQIVASAANLGIEARSPTTSAAPVNQTVIVNEVANDPRATAVAVSSRIGQAARR